METLRRVAASRAAARAGASAIILSAGALLLACANTGMAPRSFGEPRASAPVDATFSSVHRDRALWQSASYYVQGVEQSVGKRVAVGPNFVFEAGRTALTEPPTAGPALAWPNAAWAIDEAQPANALGFASADLFMPMVLNFLGSKQVQILPPASYRGFVGEVLCSKAETCGGATWVERWIHAWKSTSRPEEFPSVALAVREFGVRNAKIDLVVTQDAATGAITVAPASTGTGSICPPWSRELPTVVFRATLISLKSGQLLAHIDERRSVVPDGNGVRKIMVSTPSKTVSGAASYRLDAVDCAEVQKVLSETWDRTDAARALASDLAQRTMAAALAPLFARQ